MSDTPDIAGIAALIGDRTRATLLTALLDGRALTPTELASKTGVTKQTMSLHLSRLVQARLVAVDAQGRHRYFRLADAGVGALLEQLMGVASRLGAVQAGSAPADPAMRKARICYDHLAGDLGVLVLDSLKSRSFVKAQGAALTLTPAGEQFCVSLGIDVALLRERRRPVCRPCLDWTVRRHHLAGSLGAALMGRWLTLGWARRAKGSRAVLFSAVGERALRQRFPVR